MNIVVTGASRGIGFEICKSFLLRGDNVYAIARSKKKLQELSSFGNASQLELMAADLTEQDQLDKCCALLTERCNGIDVLINNAGYLVNKKFQETTLADFNKSVAVNLRVPYFLTQAVLPLLRRGKSAQVVNIGSMGGYPGSSKFPGLSIYSTVKGALATLSECLAEELQEHHIKVNCLALGAVQTEMLEKAFPGYIAPVSPKEMAAFIQNFILEMSSCMNGKVVPVSLNTP